MAIAVGLFTAVIGIIVLLVLQFLASLATHTHYIPHGRIGLIWLVLAGIGWAYDLTNSSNIVLRWLGFVFGVGLCEESAKLMPLVAIILWKIGGRMDIRTFLMLGFASGLGFGIGEALYCYAPWTGNYAVGSNIIRWYAAVPSHAVYTTVCAACLWKLADRLTSAEDFWSRALVVAMAVGAMAVVHGTYDTICSLGVTVSLITEALSLALLVVAVRYVVGEATEPAGLVPTPVVLGLRERLPMVIGLSWATVCLLLALGLGTSRERALRQILSAELPAEVRPYLAGVDLVAPQGSTFPMRVHLQLDLTSVSISGRFTNLSPDNLHHLAITCIAVEEPEAEREESGDPSRRRIVIGDLAPGSSTTISQATGWEFAPHEQVLLEAEGQDATTMRLP